MTDSDHAPRDEEEPLSEELRQRMQGEFNKLPLLTRQVFLAHRIDELSYTEVAAYTGISVCRVEQEMVRALLCIDRALSEPPRHRKWWRRPWSGISPKR
ncbi:MAG: RNA polymerase sigma factor [Sphingomicrobium sp.]